MNILKQNEKNIKGVLTGFDRIVDFYLEFRFMIKNRNKSDSSIIYVFLCQRDGRDKDEIMETLNI